MKRRVLLAGMMVAGLTLAGGARAYELVEVVSGSQILVTANGRQLSLLLAGVSVSAPPYAGSPGEYRGAEARELVAKMLRLQPAFIREVEPVRPDADTVRVRIRVGPNGEQDLAVVLAEAGLALADRTASTDPEHLATIRAAEKAARLAHRGIHDGGYAAFVYGSARLIDFGVGNLPSDKPRPGSYDAYLDGVATGTTRTASWAAPREPFNGIHESGVEAIRDWGKAMGLPADSSSRGH